MKDTIDNVILGAGISGVIASLYLKNSLIFEKRDFIAIDILDDSMPKYFHYNEEVKRFCEHIHFIPELEKFKVGIFYKREYIDFYNKNTSIDYRRDIYRRYISKKYSIDIDSADIDRYRNKMNSYLKNSTIEYISNKAELINHCNRMIKDKLYLNHEVNRIDVINKELEFTNGLKFSYNNLISTIPISTFLKLSGVNIDIDKKELVNAIFVIVQAPKKILEYNFIYIIDEHYRFHRVNISNDKKCISFEFNNFIDSYDCMQFLDYNKIEAFFDMTNILKIDCIDSETRKKLKFDNVEFLGRFAQGDYNIKVEDVIRRCESWKI